MFIPCRFAYNNYVFTFSARSCGVCAFPEIRLFTVPLSDAPAFHEFLTLVASEISQSVTDDIRTRCSSLRRDGWIFAIFDTRSFRFFGVGSIKSSISFFRAFYAQFEGLDDFGFYDSYKPAPIGC